MKNDIVKYNDFAFNIVNDEMFNLTDMWKAPDASDGKQPKHWMEPSTAQGFIA